MYLETSEVRTIPDTSVVMLSGSMYVQTARLSASETGDDVERASRVTGSIASWLSTGDKITSAAEE